MRETVLVLDFGSQYCQLIARRVRSLGVYCEILPCSAPWEEIERREPQAIIFSGGPASVLDEGAPEVDERVLGAGIPILGICYGMQLLGARLGGAVQKADSREYGPAFVELDRDSALFEGFADSLDVWMSHGDQVERLPEGFVPLAHSATCPIAAMGNAERRIYGVQFHPEVVHTPRGIEVLRNFLFGVAGCEGGWSMRSFIEEAVAHIRERSARTACSARSRAGWTPPWWPRC